MFAISGVMTLFVNDGACTSRFLFRQRRGVYQLEFVSPLDVTGVSRVMCSCSF